MSAATWLGLAIAVGGPLLLVSPAHQLLGDPESLRTRLLDQLALWAILAAVVGVVQGLEHRPLASLGVKPFRWQSLALGLALAAVLMWLVTPISLWLLRQTGLAGFDVGVASFGLLPLWLRILAVVTAGVVEEALFRGYALERIAESTGNGALAALVVTVGFALVHLPMWGPGPVLTLFLSGGVMTLFYLWQRDLLANVVAHVIVDAMGLIVVPHLSRTP